METDISKFKALVIEDEPFLCSMMIKKLGQSGFQVRAAYDGEEGVKAVIEYRPQVILLDILLPGIDGFEVLRRLKSDEETKKIPVVIISNLGELSDVKKAKELGAIEYFVKANYSLDEISSRVLQLASVGNN